MGEDDFTIGIEEEYLLVDRESLALGRAPEALMEACQAELGEQVSPEFLQCQIEVGTKVCRTIAEAREDLRRLRRGIARHAADHGLIPIAVSCHPFSDWKSQPHTDKARYNQLEIALAGVARRMLISGMHVHVGLAEPELRIDVMNQLSYFLPHLLALSCSSPYWVGQDTGLQSYRLTVFDNLPRTGLPPRLASWAEYQRAVHVLIDTGILEDTTKIWWDLRPSARFPTLESRICDVSPRLEHALTLAAITQCLVRMLCRLRARNQRWRIYEAFLIGENRWRAQRYGTSEGLLDLGQRAVVPFAELVEELVEMLAEDAEALGCTAELDAVREMAAGGTSADRQRAAYTAARDAGGSAEAAMRAVVAHLVDEYHADL